MKILEILFNSFAILCLVHYIIDLTNYPAFKDKYNNIEMLDVTDALSTIYAFIYLFLNIFFISGPVALLGFLLVSTVLKRGSMAKFYLITIIITLSTIIINNLILKYNLWEIVIKAM
jgi:hypothetical protein